jgi:hypothetical protein
MLVAVLTAVATVVAIAELKAAYSSSRERVVLLLLPW